MNMNQNNLNQASHGFIHNLEVKHSTYIRNEPHRIYAALTTSEGLESWFTTGSKVNAAPGGEIHFRWVNWGLDQITAEDTGLVVEAVPVERFIFQWHPDTPDYATTVEINIASVEDGTIVRLREYGFADSKSGLEAMLNCAAGWGEALTLLKFYLENGAHY